MSDVFFQIHNDLPREGPGDRASTLRALGRVADAGPVRSLLDVGCGPGMQTLALASATDAHIVALDTHRGYLDQLRGRLQRERLSARVQVVQGSMFDVPLMPESVDVVWAEGSIYVIGLERGLRAWRRFLRDGGRVAMTHLSWLVDGAPDEPRTFWARHFPEMTTVEENLNVATRCGYDVIEHFTLPESAWWDDYYRPMEERLARLRLEHRADRQALAVIERSQEQIDLYRRFADSYGYVFYILRLAAMSAFATLGVMRLLTSG